VASEASDGAWLLLLFSHLAAAAPVSVPVNVSVPDMGVAVGFAVVLLLALLPEEMSMPRRWWRARW
jgi:hypothetical protein